MQDAPHNQPAQLIALDSQIKPAEYTLDSPICTLTL